VCASGYTILTVHKLGPHNFISNSFTFQSSAFNYTSQNVTAGTARHLNEQSYTIVPVRVIRPTGGLNLQFCTFLTVGRVAQSV
jgi:hypothetical protein